VDAVATAAALRPRQQPLRPRLRGVAWLPGARPECDGGVAGCYEPLPSPSRLPPARPPPSAASRWTCRPAASSGPWGQTARGRRR
jgi:hypothetical protein